MVQNQGASNEMGEEGDEMDDMISRQAAIDASCTCHGGKHCNHYPCKDVQAIMDLPSVQPLDAQQMWIPVTEALPEKPFGCLVTVMDTEPMTMEEFENILPYFVGYDGKQWNDWEGYQCPLEVLAWMPLPEPYEPQKSEVKK